MEALSNLGINVGYLAMQITGIIVLWAILTNFTYNPILNMLEERKARIAKGLEDARQAEIARENAEAERNRILDEARAEAAKVRQEAVAQAETTGNSIKAEASNEAKAIIASAREEAEQERNKVLGGLRSQVAAISMAAANKIVGASLDESRQRELIADFFSKVPEGVSGDSAEVTSALPLTDDEMANVRKSLGADDISFKVDPSILGGLIVRVGDQIVDNSVSAQMSEMGSNLK